MNTAYLEVISLVERLHRHFLEVVKLELEGLGIHDINNVQGMMLFNIGDAEMTVGELTLRGCYLGSNVSYNVKKMVENGYLTQQRSLQTFDPCPADRKGDQAARPPDRNASAPCRNAAERRGERRRSARRQHRAPPPGAVLDPRRRLCAAPAAIRRLIFSADFYRLIFTG
jgi:hypothetical protein